MVGGGWPGGRGKADGIANVLVGHDGISTIKPAKGKGRGFVATFNIFQGTPTLLEEPLPRITLG